MAAQATSASSRPGARGAAGGPARRGAPGRKERTLVAAAALGARRGFDAISMADIGAEAGIVGSGVYRHFDSKTAILGAMADRVMDRRMTRSAAIIAAGLDEGQTLTLLVRDHIEVALTDRDALAVYHREVRTLPEDERRRLSRAQRHYIDGGVDMLAARARPAVSARRGGSVGRAPRHRRDPVHAVLPQRARRRAPHRASRGHGARL